jgi:hypothetical protein
MMAPEQTKGTWSCLYHSKGGRLGSGRSLVLLATPGKSGSGTCWSACSGFSYSDTAGNNPL